MKYYIEYKYNTSKKWIRLRARDGQTNRLLPLRFDSILEVQKYAEYFKENHTNVGIQTRIRTLDNPEKIKVSVLLNTDGTLDDVQIERGEVVL